MMRAGAGVWIAVMAMLPGLIAVTDSRSAAAQVATSNKAPAAMAPAVAQPRTLDDLIAVLETEAAKAGVAKQTVRRVLAGIEREPETLALAANQTEHDRTAGQYLMLLVSAERIEVGRTRFAEHSKTLEAVEGRYGVDRYTLAGLWGVETRYGAATGTRPILRALATLAMDEPRRPQFWRTELLQAIRIVERGDIAADQMLGSWAGAMGQTQFMPSTFNRFAVDFDGDGRRDLWGSVPDALASAANYLAQSGWQRGESWGLEVGLPDGFDYALSDPANMKPLTFWRERGVVARHGEGFPASRLDHRLLLPEGAGGPAFLVNRNFGALLRYNPAVPYALAVAHLGDRIAGRGAFLAAWPREPALSRVDRQELQERLAATGRDVGGVDGIIGSLTRSAIRSYQSANALPADGHPTAALLVRLRGMAPAGNPATVVDGAVR